MGRNNNAYLLTATAAVVATGVLLYVFTINKDNTSEDRCSGSGSTSTSTSTSKATISVKEDTKSSSSNEKPATTVDVDTDLKLDVFVSEPSPVTEKLATVKAQEPPVQHNSAEIVLELPHIADEVVAPIEVVEPEVFGDQKRVSIETPVHIENAAPSDHDAGTETCEHSPLASAGSTSPTTIMKALHSRHHKHKKKAPNPQVASVQKSLKDYRAAEGKKKKAK